MTQQPIQPQGAPWMHGAPPPRKQSRWWIWLLVAAGVIVVGCAGCLGVLTWIGATAPSTAVYTGNQVPPKFLQTMQDVGALEQGEQLLFFYSDAFMDIEESFYMVSDRKVATYSNAQRPALTAFTFDEIAGVELFRDESFFIDSEIYLELKDGRPFSFPVSSELDGDVRFFDAIEERIGE